MNRLIIALFGGLSLAVAQNVASAAILPADTTSKVEAVYLATNNMAMNDSGTNKMILLIVSDTNQCTACVSLEYGILPNSRVRDFLRESFVFWACGPEQKCTEFREYTGNGTLPIPLSYVINPYSPKGVYQFNASGADAAATYFEWLSKSLLKSTAPRVKSIRFTSPNTVVVSGASISTNVALRSVKYKVNNGTWGSVSIPLGTWASAFELPPLTVNPGVQNTLYIYGFDSSGAYRTKTNVVNLVPTVDRPAAVVSVTPKHTLAALGSTLPFAHSLSNLSGTVTYQWKHDGSPISGATAGTLTLANISAEDAGMYELEVRQNGSTFTSTPAHLWVNKAPTIAPTGNGQVRIAVEVFGPPTSNAGLEATPALVGAPWQRLSNTTFAPAPGRLGVIEAIVPLSGTSQFYRPVVTKD